VPTVAPLAAAIGSCSWLVLPVLLLLLPERRAAVVLSRTAGTTDCRESISAVISATGRSSSADELVLACPLRATGLTSLPVLMLAVAVAAAAAAAVIAVAVVSVVLLLLLASFSTALTLACLLAVTATLDTGAATATESSTVAVGAVVLAEVRSGELTHPSAVLLPALLLLKEPLFAAVVITGENGVAIGIVAIAVSSAVAL
jgi:hypothetical protein